MAKETLEAKYGLPSEVKFCKRCVMSNQRPASEIEFKHNINTKKKTLNFDEEGICDACRNADQKEKIDWQEREKQLLQLLDKYRSKDGSYDCMVPGSGGKDSAMQAHILKYKYGMNPLTITWPPILYTDYGYKNWKSWINSGFDNVTFTPNGKVMNLLTKLSIENLYHPFQTFMLGQKNLAPKLALKYNIPLIFKSKGHLIDHSDRQITEKGSFNLVDTLIFPEKMIRGEYYLELSVTNPGIKEFAKLKSKLKILDPTIFPAHRPLCLCRAAAIDAPNSGKLVPIATMVSPTST